MGKIALKTFTSNLRKLSWQKFHSFLTYESTSHYACRNSEMNSEIYNYQPIQFCVINSLIESWGWGTLDSSRLYPFTLIISQDKLDEDHKETLKYISLVGCCVSIFFCLLAALGFSFAMYVMMLVHQRAPLSIEKISYSHSSLS